ncbi:DUF4307 domain-containing protein [Arthrobacter zhaoguopingii]|uniref:DUF4307 domain-containing protein n=1 Tax=Arthrobacter zhaoguopingii TaxID=2681491 RepID=UPI001FE70CF0|nr:DUF4307 domain-containing protein [Arthrobacter zhaoguopingii]
MSSGNAPTPRVANRYGAPKPVRAAGRRRWWVIGALAAAVIAIGIFAFSTGAPRVSFKDVGFSFSSGQQARVDFEVTKPTDATAHCAVQVLSENYAVVGWKVVTIGPGAASEGAAGRTTAQQVELRTDSPGVSGGVDSCWIAGTRD